MKKTMIVFSAMTLLLSGCAEGNKTGGSHDDNFRYDKLLPYKGDAYEAFTKSNSEAAVPQSYTAGTNISYKMSYSDNTQSIFLLDQVLKADHISENPNAQLTQNIQSNGIQVTTDGNYYDGRLYNSYNGITYYEDMSFADLKKTTLLPLDPVLYRTEQIQSITANTTTDNHMVYTIVLNEDDAKSLFTDRYDSYGVNAYDGYKVVNSQIVDTFDENGYFISEKTKFDISVTYSGYEVGITFESSVEYLNINQTVVEFDEDTKKKETEYVSYDKIDTSEMNTESYDDSPEATVEETFKKRLKNRIGYEVSDNGQYQISYNDAEAYIIDFSNKTFIYSNYSIRYIYNWKGDVGSLGACTLDFKTDAASTSCEESTLEMIRTVKSYLQMELYYCGLSLDDLQSEVN